MVRLKERHRRDFEAYVRWRQRSREDPVGDFNPNPTMLRDKGEHPAILVFIEIDSQGKSEQLPDDPQLLADAQDGKQLLNGSIKEWAGGYWYCGGRLWLEKELRPDFPWLPDWVFKAVVEQARRNNPPTQEYHLGVGQAYCGVEPTVRAITEIEMMFLEERLCPHCVDEAYSQERGWSK